LIYQCIDNVWSPLIACRAIYTHAHSLSHKRTHVRHDNLWSPLIACRAIYTHTHTHTQTHTHSTWQSIEPTNRCHRISGGNEA